MGNDKVNGPVKTVGEAGQKGLQGVLQLHRKFEFKSEFESLKINKLSNPIKFT